MPPAASTLDMTGCVTAVWLTVLGGAIGSFLNVVVYRLPRGLSLIEPPSHCPMCKKPIRWFDNVPVFGWIVLRGRCRDCRTPISMRYPLIEALTAAMFGLLAASEYLSGGANLPLRAIELVEGVTVTGLNNLQLYTIYGYHLVLLCTLLCAVLIEYDGNRLPWGLFVPAGIVGLATPLLWPHLHPVSAWTGLHGLAAGGVDGPIGLAAGTILGLAAWRYSRHSRCSLREQTLVRGANHDVEQTPVRGANHDIEQNAGSRSEPRRSLIGRQTGLIWTAACVGLFLGWQAALVLIATTVLIQLPFAIVGRRRPGVLRIPPTAWLTLATLAWLLAWGSLVSWAEAL